MADIQLSDELIELERKAWAEIQAGTLTVDTAWAVQSKLIEVADGDQEKRLKLELALKKAVRHAE